MHVKLLFSPKLNKSSAFFDVPILKNTPTRVKSAIIYKIFAINFIFASQELNYVAIYTCVVQQ